MKRRKFFKDIGLGIGSGMLTPGILAQDVALPVYRYPSIKFLIDATNENGEVSLRFVLTNNGVIDAVKNIIIKVKGKGKLSRTKSYFLEPPDQCVPNREKWNANLFTGDTDVLVAWIKDAAENTKIQVRLGKEHIKFELAELLEAGQLDFGDEVRLSANLLGYSEVGRLPLLELKIPDTDNFRFVIMADPQGGNPLAAGNEAPTRMKIHNAFIEETVSRINELNPEPIFSLVLGDFVDSKGQAPNFLLMEELLRPLKTPVLLAVGNHETPYNADFEPAYKMDDLDNFFASQKRINQTNKILYSFDLGKWHFIVWPDPLRSNFWVSHPHYFDWLEQDLELHKDKLVVFLHHVPLHPIGIDPLTSYVESVSVKRLLLDILAEHGNVKYVFSGHVHIPLKASLKTAVSYKGMQMINLPAAGFRSRAFGEADFFGGPEQGACVVDVIGEEFNVHFQHVTKEWFTYPKVFREFDEHKYALWLNQPWELPLQPQIKNGNFQNGLYHWHQRYVYHEDENPSNICKVVNVIDKKQVLHLYSRKRDYNVPGQDRLPQHINRIAQAVSLEGVESPILNLSYQLESGRYRPDSLNGFFVLLECYSGAKNVANLIYSPGKVFGGLTKGFGQKRAINDMHFDLPLEVGIWHETSLPIAADFEQNNDTDRSFEKLHADRVVIYLGTWTVNEGIGQEAGVYIKQVSLTNQMDSNIASPLKKKGDIWHSRISHIAGDHQYTEQSKVYPEGLRGVGKSGYFFK